MDAQDIIERARDERRIKEQEFRTRRMDHIYRIATVTRRTILGKRDRYLIQRLCTETGEYDTLNPVWDSFDEDPGHDSYFKTLEAAQSALETWIERGTFHSLGSDLNIKETYTVIINKDDE